MANALVRCFKCPSMAVPLARVGFAAIQIPEGSPLVYKESGGSLFPEFTYFELDKTPFAASVVPDRTWCYQVIHSLFVTTPEQAEEGALDKEYKRMRRFFKHHRTDHRTSTLLRAPLHVFRVNPDSALYKANGLAFLILFINSPQNEFFHAFRVRDVLVEPVVSPELQDLIDWLPTVF